MTILKRIMPGVSRLAVAASLVVMAATLPALAGNANQTRPSACRFESLAERTRNNPLSRASYTALQWVEYEDRSERFAKLVESMTSARGVSQGQAATIGFAYLHALNQLSMTHPLHRCFNETFTSDQTLDTYFPDIVFVKGRLALETPYAMVIPINSDDPVVLILPTAMYRFQRSIGSLRVFDKQRKEYVEVDPHARRGIDRLIQTNLAKVKK